MKVIIDRIEGEYAVVELPDRTFADIPMKVLDAAKEGDVISILVDPEETEGRRQHISALMNKLFVG